jgi:uncharacterized membrane protein YjjP (DUF1212 family)
MSQYQNPHDEDIPRYEPWLGMMGASFVPVTLLLFLHGQFAGPLIGASVILFAGSLLMLRRQTTQRRAELESAGS